MAGMSGLEPLNTGVKVQRLNQLGYIPFHKSLRSHFISAQTYLTSIINAKTKSIVKPLKAMKKNNCATKSIASSITNP